MNVTVYVCPTPGCPDYYGASGIEDLSAKINHDLKGKPTFSRAMCPTCRTNGIEAERQPVTVAVVRPSAR